VETTITISTTARAVSSTIKRQASPHFTLEPGLVRQMPFRRVRT
jgi:hypothetical protein